MYHQDKGMVEQMNHPLVFVHVPSVAEGTVLCFWRVSEI